MSAIPKDIQATIFNRNWCPVCKTETLFGKKLICPKCGTHVRDEDNTHQPIGVCWYIYFNPERKGKFQGWTYMENAGYKMKFDERNMPTEPKDDYGRTHTDDYDDQLTEATRRRAGVRQ